MLIPYLIVREGKSAVEFYKAGLHAQVTFEPMVDDTGRIGHCELQLPDGSKVMLADEYPEMGIVGPGAAKAPGPMLVLQIADPDKLAAAMERAGAEVVQPFGDDGHGGRAGRFRDPYGYLWIISAME
jgi:PhnB protein